ncbi:MAG: aminotransferase class I/II-fold pyridoxal phosphate-dependent enzyme, partial [Bacteroidota bacterium]
AKYRARRDVAFRIMDTLGCQYRKDQVGLFVWARCPAGVDGYQLSDQALYNHDVFLTPGGIFGTQGDQYLRISLCANEATFREALNRLKTR